MTNNQTVRATYFIADLHLDEKYPAMTAIFARFLASIGSEVDALYILGDFFEAWIGDDLDTAFTRQIKSYLKAATDRGFKIYLQHGNRDFLIGKKFLAETGCNLIADEHVIHLYDTRVLLMHGDTLCTNDIAYQKSRRLLRNPVIKFLFRCLPLTKRLKIADSMREKSKRYTQITDLTKMDVAPETVVQRMQAHNVNILIHGHTHRPDIHEFAIDHQAAKRIVMAAWHETGSVFIWHADNQYSFQELK